jgi:hypothetical protein
MESEPLLRFPEAGMSTSRLTTVNDNQDMAQADFEADPSARWQMRLLPFMATFVALVAVAFLALSIFDILLIRKSIDVDPATNALLQIEKRLDAQKLLLTPDQVTQQSLLVLEADALERRYHQANALVMARIWTKHMAFIIGVILALLGAVFILGKMTESTSQITGGNGMWKVGITSASPGIILAVLGTALLIVTIFVEGTITVNDRPVYIGSGIAIAPPPVAGGTVSPGQSTPPADILNRK